MTETTKTPDTLALCQLMMARDDAQREVWNEVDHLRKNGHTMAELARVMGVSRATLYRQIMQADVA